MLEVALLLSPPSSNEPPARAKTRSLQQLSVAGYCAQAGGSSWEVSEAPLLVVSVRLAEVNTWQMVVFSLVLPCNHGVLTGKRDVPCDSGGRARLAHLVTLLLLKQINLFCLMNEHELALFRSVSFSKMLSPF